MEGNSGNEVVAFLILSEPIPPALLIGGAVILFGVWLVNR
jgi:drug/metabolite transporter (DMT)-like permease